MHHKAKRSNYGVCIHSPTRVSHDTSYLMSQASFEGRSMPHKEPPPLDSTMYYKAKRSNCGVSTHSPTRVSHDTLNLMPQASFEGHAMSQREPPPLGFIHHKAKRSKYGVPTHSPTRVSRDTSNLMPQASFEGHFMPYKEPPPQVAAPPSSSTQTSYAVRKSTRKWTVEAIVQDGSRKKIELTMKDVFDMPKGQLIVVPFDRQMRAYGQAAVLLSKACGCIARDPDHVPINFESWKAVLDDYKKECFKILKNLFHFQAPELIAKRYCFLTMGKKYRNGKLKLWNSKDNPCYSREQLIGNVPKGVPKDQWSSFVDYHLKPKYKELCQKNVEARKKQTIPHTGGSKLLSRRQHEMEIEVGHAISRRELYIATHKRKDGSYVNEEARFVGEQVEQELSQTNNFVEVSKNDALSKILGPDRAGCVRGLGLGALHSVAFGSTSGIAYNSSAEVSQLKEELNFVKSKLATSEENISTLQTIMFAFMQMKELNISANLGALFATFTQMDNANANDEPVQTADHAKGFH